MIPPLEKNADIINLPFIVKNEVNFLPSIFFYKLKNLITSTNFQWYFQSETISSLKDEVNKTKKESQNNFMFAHNLYKYGQGKSSNWAETFEPIIYFIAQKYKVKELLRMKLNLYTNQHKKIKHGSHHDFKDKGVPVKNVKIGLFNFVTCNGGTSINNKIYSSNENELLIFSNDLKHHGITQTDSPIRIVLNIGWK